jgi:type IV secretory pathway TrbD component
VADRDRLESPDPGVAPPAEVIHMPGPSYMPAVLAFGVMLALVGVITTWFLTGIGVVIAVVAMVRWIGQARRDMSELPLEHEPEH